MNTRFLTLASLCLSVAACAADGDGAAPDSTAPAVADLPDDLYTVEGAGSIEVGEDSVSVRVELPPTETGFVPHAIFEIAFAGDLPDAVAELSGSYGELAAAFTDSGDYLWITSSSGVDLVVTTRSAETPSGLGPETVTIAGLHSVVAKYRLVPEVEDDGGDDVDKATCQLGGQGIYECTACNPSFTSCCTAICATTTFACCNGNGTQNPQCGCGGAGNCVGNKCPELPDQ